jgi:cell division protein FtsB
VNASVTPAASRGPRPLVAFFLSLIGSAVVLGLLVLSDGRVLELKKARADVRELDRRVGALQQDNARLRAAVEGARRHDFPAERVAREELHLVKTDDLVLLYPDGSLSGRSAVGAVTPTPAIRPASP